MAHPSLEMTKASTFCDVRKTDPSQNDLGVHGMSKLNRVHNDKLLHAVLVWVPDTDNGFHKVHELVGAVVTAVLGEPGLRSGGIPDLNDGLL